MVVNFIQNTTEAIRSLNSIMRRKDTFPNFPADLDPETEMSYLRLNFIFDRLCDKEILTGIKECLAKDTVTDTYSFSQQIGNLFYLYKSTTVSEKDFIDMYDDYLRSRVNFIASNYEFKRNNLWFTNHLLNNYRALILFPKFINREVEASIYEISDLICHNIDTLFYPELLVSVEGSTNYELLVAKHCVEISLVGSIDTDLEKIIAERLPKTRAYFQQNYFWGNKPTLPQFGDISPDWSSNFALEFLEYFVRGKQNHYGKLCL